MSACDTLKNQLQSKQHTWWITGATGFSGGNFLEAILQLKQNLICLCTHLKDAQSVYSEFRAGVVLRSLSSINKAMEMLGYVPTQSKRQGLVLVFAMPWYQSQSQEAN
jgi:hypothetical protein